MSNTHKDKIYPQKRNKTFEIRTPGARITNNQINRIESEKTLFHS